MNKTLTVYIRSWRDFTKVVKLLAGEDWMFRGQRDADWALDSMLDRDLAKQLAERSVEFKSTQAAQMRLAEQYAIGTFRKLTTRQQSFGERDVDLLATMQHYGTSTRLLDFTTSIYVALFFAFEEKITRKPRAIYAIRYGDIIDCARLKQAYKVKLDESDIPRDEGTESGRRRFNHLKLTDFIFECAEKNIKKGDSENGVLPLYTVGTNDRLTAQAGVFLMPRTFNGLAVNLAATLNVSVSEVNAPSKSIEDISHMKFGDGRMEESLIKLIFDSSLETDAWDMLDQANISPRTIYPDLTGIAKSVRYSNRFLRIGLD